MNDFRESKLAVSTFMRAARQNRGLSERALARRLGVSHTTVQRWEAGLATPPPDRLSTFARILGLEAGETQKLLELAGHSVHIDLPPAMGVDEVLDPAFLRTLVQDAEDAWKSGEQDKALLYAGAVASITARAPGRVYSEVGGKACLLKSRILNLRDEPLPALTAAYDALSHAHSASNTDLEIEAGQLIGVIMHKLNFDEWALGNYERILQQLHVHRLSRAREIALIREVATAKINCADFDRDLYDSLNDAVRYHERAGDIHGMINYREVRSRARATERKISEARSDIESLWNEVEHLDITPLERVRILVIRFKVRALDGQLIPSIEIGQQINELIEAYGLYIERHCLRNITEEVVDHLSDSRWRTLLRPVTSPAR